MVFLVVVGVIAAALVAALLYDWRNRRRGSRSVSAGQIAEGAFDNRLDAWARLRVPQTGDDQDWTSQGRHWPER